MKISIEVALQHGVIFIYDPYEDYDLPPDTGVSEFTYTESCVCFWVPSYIDGEASIIVSEKPLNEDVNPDFSGAIRATGESIGISDPIGNYYCLMRITDSVAFVNIWNFQVKNRQKSWVQIKNLNIL